MVVLNTLFTKFFGIRLDGHEVGRTLSHTENDWPRPTSCPCVNAELFS